MCLQHHCTNKAPLSCAAVQHKIIAASTKHQATNTTTALALTAIAAAAAAQRTATTTTPAAQDHQPEELKEIAKKPVGLKDRQQLLEFQETKGFEDLYLLVHG